MKTARFFLILAASIACPPTAFADCAVPQADGDTPSCQSDTKSDTKSDSTSKPTDKTDSSSKLAPEYVRVTRPRSFSGGMPSAAVRVRYVPVEEQE